MSLSLSKLHAHVPLGCRFASSGCRGSAIGKYLRAAPYICKPWRSKFVAVRKLLTAIRLRHSTAASDAEGTRLATLYS